MTFCPRVDNEKVTKKVPANRRDFSFDGLRGDPEQIRTADLLLDREVC